MALRDWDKSKWVSGWIFEGKTDYDTGRKYQPYSIYIYKKGWFRGREDRVVVKFNHKSDHQKDEIVEFKSELEAQKYVQKYMGGN